MPRVRIAWNGGEVIANFLEKPSVKQLVAVLPSEALAQTWGEEVYFELPVQMALEPDARQVVEPGTVCFWVQGSSLALPFGPTPASTGEDCCVTCSAGKACGDSCIANDAVCSQPDGCACDAADVGADAGPP